MNRKEEGKAEEGSGRMEEVVKRKEEESRVWSRNGEAEAEQP